ncbi:MAG: ABC transporter ATP-binding protein [Cellulomonas sp.]|nr:ABC transporter ATP-binding protein [Cellulomonas sp.]
MSWGASGLDVTFGGRRVLHQVDLHVDPGQVVAVVGGDGAGKTTLLRALVGGARPSAGSVRNPGRDRTGFMPANASTWADLSVDENIDFVASAYGVRGTDLAQRRAELLTATGLMQARGRTSAQLSGWMRQKLGFALASIHRPELLVLDEPTTGVDPVSRVELWRLVSAAAAAGTAVVMATTYLDEAERAAVVIVLSQGRVLLSGPAADVVRQAPGTVLASADGIGPDRSWRRGHERHGWVPPGQDPPAGALVLVPDLEDAVIAATLQQEATDV